MKPLTLTIALGVLCGSLLITSLHVRAEGEVMVEDKVMVENEVMLNGRLQRPNEKEKKAKYKAVKSNGHWQFLAIIYPKKEYRFQDVTYTDGITTFVWPLGELNLSCKLRRQEDQGYLGKCPYPNSESDKNLLLTVYPPPTE